MSIMSENDAVLEGTITRGELEHAYVIDQNVQYHNQTTTGVGQTITVGGLFEHGTPITAVSYENNEKNVTYIVLPKQQNKVKKSYMCNYCNYTTEQRHSMSHHLKTHSNEYPHKCGVCEHRYKFLRSLQDHINVHIGVKPYQCQSCPKAFTRSGELLRHVQYAHTHEKSYKCGICDYACVERCRARDHMKMCHFGERERPYKCPQCTYAATRVYDLERHLRVHSGENPYECEICFSRFKQSISLKNHRLQHTGGKPSYKCDQCPKTSSRKADLHKHVQKLHTTLDKPIECKICGDTFPDCYQYNVHCKSHKGEKCHKCKLCPYATMFKFSLVSHMLIHTNEKPFHCKICDQFFRRYPSLRRHNNLFHSPVNISLPQNEFTYHQCNTCKRQFKNKGNLFRHIQGHTKELMLNNQNTATKQRLEYTGSANEDEPEND